MEAKFFRLLRIGYMYRARVIEGGRLLRLQLGTSHEVELTIPPAVRVFVFKPHDIVCVGIDKERTYQFAAAIRNCKPWNIYTGDGLSYADEVKKRKPGKNGLIKPLLF